MPFLSIFGKLSLMETKNLRLSEDLCNFTNEKFIAAVERPIVASGLLHRKRRDKATLFGDFMLSISQQP